MTDQKVVRIRYAAGDGTRTTRAVEPVLFGSTNGHWYLIGWCRLRHAMRWFRLDRIQRAVVTSAQCGDHAIDEVGAPPATARPVQGREDW
ncbi:MAG: WYL domain-containing protein [Propionibacteriaceae bacterium]|nr:WYL domain-containing protein [Propionibacteriaceae bacterium]